MEKGLHILAFLEKANKIPVVDVRTPAEFNQGHIPVAYNIPLFSDDERTRVGITYKQVGKKEAVIAGLEFAGPKMKNLALQASKIATNNTLLVHCWRGGMRSESMAWLFKTVGLESNILEGGYKSFRRFVLEYLEKDFPFIVIGGLTGSGKTDVLHELSKKGQQVLDLEKLASHKGSAFGGLGEKDQRTNEQFENDIFWALSNMDLNRPIWIEDESRNIGRNILPAGIHKSIRSSSLIFLDVPLHERVDRLVKDYAKFQDKDLCAAVEKIRPRLGDQAARDAIQGIKDRDYDKTARLVLHYYDKTYRYGLDKREEQSVHHIEIEISPDIELATEHIRKFSEENHLI